jgi:hypothetical protein
VYLVAAGVRLAPGKVEVPSQALAAWVSAVDRIVLLAAVNRGWTISSAMSPFLRFVAPLLIGLGHVLDLVPGRTPVIFQIRRGSAHLTNLRLKWMALEKANPGQLPPVIQLLGTVDDIVAPDDNIDLATGTQFIYLEVAHSGHFDVLDTTDPIHGATRAELICAALRERISDLEKRPERRVVRTHALPNELAANIMSSEPTAGRQHRSTAVCFIMHGIRDNGHWTRKIGDRVLTRSDRLGKRCYIYTPSYGFFPLLSFSLPWTRREKVEWFLDLYVDALSRHPSAEMVFVGHSNGTYLLAKALSLCPSVRFDRVLFAGSVVRRNYDWPSRIAQAEQVVNLVATADWVVASFPRAFEILPLQDLGGAGHDGFRTLSKEANRKYVPGNHSAGIREEVWDDIAVFAVSGEQPMHAGQTLDGRLKLASHRSWFVCLLGWLSPMAWLLIFGSLAMSAYWILFILPIQYTAFNSWHIAILFSIYTALVVRLLTKF